MTSEDWRMSADILNQIYDDHKQEPTFYTLDQEKLL